MARLDGKVAFITGAARGQGRSHALTLAREGAEIVAVDLCDQVRMVPYSMPTTKDLDDTVRMVEDLDRRIIARQADVREMGQLKEAVEEGISQFGHIDIVCANAGIWTVGDSTWELTEEQWSDVIDINLSGVWKTCRAVVPHMIEAGRGGSIIITSSTAGIKGIPYSGHYAASKHGVVGLARTLAIELAKYGIRVNTVHPTGVKTPMVQNDFFGPFVEAHPDMATGMTNLLPVDLVDAQDISNAVLWLASDEARYVTGIMLPVDAGATQS